MGRSERILISLGLVSAFLILLLFIVLVAYFRRRKAVGRDSTELWRFRDLEESETEQLISFPGGENLTIHDILDAPGEVVGKSSYGTMYKASLQRSSSAALLRFVRPACAERLKEIVPSIQMLGFVRHPNLVPLLAFYSGARGEKLLVYPFFRRGNLSRFLRDGSCESHRWLVIYKILLGIAKGLDHLHTGLQKPIIHGNLKSKNVLLGSDYQPYLSDFSLHLVLNPTAGQEMLEALADQGYKAPELIKMKDTSKESDIYSFGVILLEILTGKEPIDGYSVSPLDHLPNIMRNAILHHRVTEMFNPQLLSQSNSGNSITETTLHMIFQLAMSCCSPSPALRPDSKQIIRELEEIGQ